MEDFDGINKGTFQVNGNYAVGDGAAIDVSNKKTINNTFNDNTTNHLGVRVTRRFYLYMGLGALAIAVIIIVAVAVPVLLKMRSNSSGGAPPPATFTTGTHSPSPVATDPPPIATADGVYLCNWNDTVNSMNKGSAYAYYKRLDLEHNKGQNPDDWTTAAPIGTFAQWEETPRTGVFNNTGTNFTAFINQSMKAVASLPYNTAVGWAQNGPIGHSVPWRNFTVYKHDGTPLYNDTAGSTYWPLYYAL